jgi:hypothetical protein
VSDRDVDDVRASLAAIVKAAQGLAADAEDLHAVAYDRQARDHVKVAGGDGAGIEDIGDPQARKLWRRLVKHTENLETSTVALAKATAGLLSAGPSAPPTRGSKVAPGEFARALRHQRERQAAGEYTPRRTETQPRYPGGKT